MKDYIHLSSAHREIFSMEQIKRILRAVLRGLTGQTVGGEKDG